MTIYRGYDIKRWKDGYLWTNENDVDQFAGEPRVPFATEAKAMDSIDDHVRDLRHCDDCGYSTTEGDVTVCPDQRCRGSVG